MWRDFTYSPGVQCSETSGSLFLYFCQAVKLSFTLFLSLFPSSLVTSFYKHVKKTATRERTCQPHSPLSVYYTLFHSNVFISPPVPFSFPTSLGKQENCVSLREEFVSWGQSSSVPRSSSVTLCKSTFFSLSSNVRIYSYVVYRFLFSLYYILKHVKKKH